MYQISQASVDDRTCVESEKVRTPPESDRGDTEAVKDTTNNENVDDMSTESQTEEAAANTGIKTTIELIEEELNHVNHVLKHYVKLLSEQESLGDDSKSRGDDMARKLAPLIKHSNRFILDLAPKVRHLHSKFTLGGYTLPCSNPHSTYCYVQRTCLGFTAEACAAIVGYLRYL